MALHSFTYLRLKHTPFVTDTVRIKHSTRLSCSITFSPTHEHPNFISVIQSRRVNKQYNTVGRIEHGRFP